MKNIFYKWYLELKISIYSYHLCFYNVFKVGFGGEGEKILNMELKSSVQFQTIKENVLTVSEKDDVIFSRSHFFLVRSFPLVNYSLNFLLEDNIHCISEHVCVTSTQAQDTAVSQESPWALAVTTLPTVTTTDLYQQPGPPAFLLYIQGVPQYLLSTDFLQIEV